MELLVRWANERILTIEEKTYPYGRKNLISGCKAVSGSIYTCTAQPIVFKICGLIFIPKGNVKIDFDGNPSIQSKMGAIFWAFIVLRVILKPMEIVGPNVQKVQKNNNFANFQ